MRLTEKVVLITGAAGGQGRREALLCAEEGAIVIATDVNVQALETLETELRDVSDKDHMTMIHDISKEIDWQRIVTEVKERFGRIDVLINNAGIIGNVESYHHTTIDEFHRVMDTNVWGTYLGMRTVILVMKEQQAGSIINVSSIASMIGLGLSPYGASKGAVRSMTKSAAGDFAKYNVRVNVVLPGFIETNMIKDQLENEQRHDWYVEKTPLKRIGRIDDVAPAVVFLASDESQFMTGAELVVDGGVTAI
ncbi:glucose 1-dehydrogenase [Macrococcus equipercicus]|uniref:Glucose 1-dehydrogenase n=1 Tax=Macrococcus equipercicus TaxID=69967 RepID=A0ABQ6RB30_9STAP|nr:glucose 1-dehydrogenase [Macrococcus equipercicus]KAA1042437.1 glucose 1-dehydrogenase [Macrococcus equipercicus]